MKQGTEYRSDDWRMHSYDDVVKEIAHVTRAIGDYFGSAIEDRTYQITWAPMVDTLGKTSVKDKHVILNPALLNGKTAPFTPGDVDTLLAVSAHEAGHVAIAQVQVAAYVGPYASAGELMAVNIVEDMLIDGPAYRAFNAGLAELTSWLREAEAAEQISIGEAIWRNTARTLASVDLLKLWGVMRLHGAKLPAIGGRIKESEIVRRLDTVADDLLDTASVTSWDTVAQVRDVGVIRIMQILDQYTPPAPAPAPAPNGDQQDQDDAEGGQDDDAGSAQDDSTADGKDDAADAGEGEGNPGNDKPGDGAGSDGAKREPTGTEAIPEACPNDNAGAADRNLNTRSKAGRQLWDSVGDEQDQLDARRPVQGKGNLSTFTDKRMIDAIRAAFDKLASEPDRSRRQDRGKVDRRQLPYISYRDDIFTALTDTQVSGKIVMLIDLSGSMRNDAALVKRVAASLYVALERTKIDVTVYSYSAGIRGINNPPLVLKLADPHAVSDHFDSATANGGTPTGRALSTVLKVERVKPRSENLLIHLTDGQPDAQNKAREAMDAASADGWQMVNVFARLDQRQQFTAPGRINVFIPKFEALPKVIEEIITSIVKSAKNKAQR